MNVLLFTIEVVGPIVLLSAVGYFLRRINILSDSFIEKGNALVFKVLCPCSIFYGLYSMDMTSEFNASLALFTSLAIIISVALLYVFVPLFIKDRRLCGSFIHGSFRNNSLMVGMYLVVSLYGQAGMVPYATMFPIVVMLFNLFAVVTLTIFAPRDANLQKFRVGAFLWDVIRNPIMVGSILGIASSLIGFKLPVFVEDTIVDLGKIFIPFGLVLMGGQFRLGELKGNLKLVTAGTLMRLVVVPGLTVVAAILCGWRGMALGTIYAIFCSSVSTAITPMAQSMNSDADFSAQLVIVSAFFSAFTIFIGVFVLRAMELI